jgi:AraC-like DNA-binding protein
LSLINLCNKLILTAIGSGASAMDRKQSVAAGSLISFSTDALPAFQRKDYWHSEVLRRLDTTDKQDNPAPFKAQLIRLPGSGAELLRHSSSSLFAQRDAARCRADGCDDICIDFIAASVRSSIDHAGARQLKAGDMMVIDLALPTHMQRAKHQVISLFIARNIVQAAIGDARALAGRMLAPVGVAAMLRSHMHTTMEQAHAMSPAQRVMAIQMAREMALSILQTESHDDNAADEFAAGFYQAAKIFIGRKCTDPDLTPERVASAIGCSRAGLYRAFLKHGQSVAAAIWTARVEHANALLMSPACISMPISEIAFRSGFTDHSTFNRLFKRTYGLAPGEKRRIG